MNALFSRRYIPVICYSASEQYSSSPPPHPLFLSFPPPLFLSIFLSLSLSLSLSLFFSLFTCLSLSAILPLGLPSWSSAVHSGKQGSTSVPRWFSVHTRIYRWGICRGLRSMSSPDPLVVCRWLCSYMPRRLATRSSSSSLSLSIQGASKTYCATKLRKKVARTKKKRGKTREVCVNMTPANTASRSYRSSRRNTSIVVRVALNFPKGER